MRALAGLLLSGLVSWPVLAQGGFNGPGAYEITNIKSGKVLDLDRNDQTTVIQFSPRGTDNQVWDIRPVGGGYFVLRNAMNGNALDAGGGRNSEPLRGIPFNGRESQQWRFEPGKDGNVLIISRLGKTIDIPDGTDRDGERVQVYDPNGDSNQRFAFRRASGRRQGAQGFPLPGLPGQPGYNAGAVINCASDDGRRAYCNADTRNGVTLSRQISGSACTEGQTWGYDQRGIWVDRGCRAEFILNGRGGGDRGYYRGDDRGNDRGRANTLTCESNNGGRVVCQADTRSQTVQLVRQISGSPCRQGETWGWDRRGIWVDRGCRAEFALVPTR